MSIYIFYINEPGKEVYDNNNNNDNDDNNDDDVNSNSLFSCCHSDWAGLFSSLQISQTCCLNTAIVLIQLLSVCLLLSPFFPSSLAVWAVMLFSTCQNTKLSLRSAFFILWLRHRRSEELCDRRDADKLVHCFEGPFFFCAHWRVERNIMKGKWSLQAVVSCSLQFPHFELVMIVALASSNRGWGMVSLEYF